MREDVANEKESLIERMERQRFLPITEETASLYDDYEAVIDQRDPDDLCRLLFYRGEYFYRVGSFHDALGQLTRCLQAPKSEGLDYLDARSYNIIGLIHGYLGQESLSISYHVQARSLARSLGCPRDAAASCANLGLLYAQLESFDAAMAYLDEAISLAGDDSSGQYSLGLSCKACRGILFCKQGRLDEAREALREIEGRQGADSDAGAPLDCREQAGETAASLDCKEQTSEDEAAASLDCKEQPKDANASFDCKEQSKDANASFDCSLASLRLRIAEREGDEAAFSAAMGQLLRCIPSERDFLEMSETYFDVCGYLLQESRVADAERLLDYVGEHVSDESFVFLRYVLLQFRACCAYLKDEDGDVREICEELLALRPQYLREQESAKIYSLEYIERIFQTRSDSEAFREKSRIDQMTGLLNKHTVQFLIEEDLAKNASRRQSAMLLIDLDHFKQINDTLGHLAGDKLICETARTIQGHFGDDALCGRVGGDEFLVYLTDTDDHAYIELQAEMLRQEIERQTSAGKNVTLRSRASIGIAFSSEYCFDFENLFSAVDAALYRAKSKGRNKVVVAGAN